MEVIARELQLEVERRRDWEQHQEENIHKLMERQDSMNTRVTSIWAVCMFLAAAIPIGLTILGLLIK